MQEASRTIRASAPARVDLAGGTLDIWPLYLLVERAVTVNVAIRHRARAEVRSSGSPDHLVRAADIGREVRIAARHGGGPFPAGFGELPLHEAVLRQTAPRGGLTVLTSSDVPAGSGLGGSSSLAVSLLAAILTHEGSGYSLEGLAALARDIEARVIEAPTGTQDHLAALFGGVAAIHYEAGPEVREPISIPPADLEARGVLAYLGASRASARANWDMIRRALDNEPATRRGFSAIADIARRMREALLRSDFEACGKLLGEEWEERRGLSPQVATPETEKALSAARRAGAAGGKICGAGGGGSLFVMGPPDAKAAITESLRGLGCRILDFQVDPLGLQVAT